MEQEINSTLTTMLEKSDAEKMYDEQCKKILSNKMMLAWIMKDCVWEFKNIPIIEIANKYIEGDPLIGKAKVFDGETIQGLPTEIINANHGKIFFDIRYKVMIPSHEETIELIVNLEAQNKFYPGYPLIKRGSFYSASMIVNQHGIEFGQLNYNKLKKVYSIWVAYNVPKYLQNTITRYDTTETNIVGNVREEKKNYDLQSVVMIYLGQPKDDIENNTLHILNNVLSSEVTAEEKLELLENKYGIKKTLKLQKELTHMCNLSRGILDKGIGLGIEQGQLKEKFENAKNFLEMGLSSEQVAKGTKLSLEEVTQLKIQMQIQ